jgi:hypothetical protein
MKYFSKQGLLILVIGIVLGGTVGFFSRSSHDSDEREFYEQRQSNVAQPFVNPLLSCGDDRFSNLSNRKVVELEQKHAI